MMHTVSGRNARESSGQVLGALPFNHSMLPHESHQDTCKRRGPLLAPNVLSSTASATDPLEALRPDAVRVAPNLAYEDMVMRCVDRHSPPGYLTIEVIRDVLDVSLGDAMQVFACAGDAWYKQRIAHMPDSLRALEKTTISKKRDAQRLLWAIHEDDVRRGTIWRQIKRDESHLQTLETLKKQALPYNKSSGYIRKWLASDPEIAQLRASIQQAQTTLRVLPSEHRLQTRVPPPDSSGNLIDL